MSEVVTESPQTVQFTQAAVDKVWLLLQEEGDLTLNLRAYISGGGCSGFQYGFTFDPNQNPDDTVVEGHIEADGKDHTIRLLIDMMSYQYLNGAEIDFKTDLNGERFIIRNPNAKTTCGCGSSFSVD